MAKEYKISGYGEEDVSPEETLADSFSSYSKVETPISSTVLQVFYGLIALVFGFFILTAFKLEVLNGKDFRALAIGNRSSVYDIPAMRGNIFDRSGEVLGENQPVFDLVAISADLPKKEELAVLIQDLREILGDDLESLQKSFEQRDSQAIFFIRKDLDKERVLQIQNKYTRGVYVINSVTRKYPEGVKFSSVLGYTGKVSTEDLLDTYYDINDRKGRAGIEASFENYLRGEHGRIFFDRANNRYIPYPSKPGQSLVLNIDAEVQRHLYDSVNEILRAHGLKYGSAVAQNPNTGEVLGMVSFPAYDNNELSSEISEDLYQKYFISKDRPLFNRALGGRFNPGSTIKAILALAGLKEKVITPNTTITDSMGYISIPNIYNPEIVYRYRDWRVQGTVDLKKALAWSSDIYFYSVGGGYGAIKGLGYDRLEKYYRAFLIDRALGIDVPGESAGFVPDEKWKIEKFGQPWFTGDTYNVSIGQGDLVVTPLWLSSYISALANGGTFYKPVLVKKVVDGDKKDVKVFGSEELAKLPFDRATLDIVRDGLREVVVSGTGQLLGNLPVKIAAKTGTAEVVSGAKVLNSLLVAYGPYENPEIAISVVIENIGPHQGLALQAAKKFLEWYFPAPAPVVTPVLVSPSPVDNVD
ncbi:MAG: penicillin-binding protein 2 [bacterium]|nr:penicillin-binding protein 2 [bacterium]